MLSRKIPQSRSHTSNNLIDIIEQIEKHEAE